MRRILRIAGWRSTARASWWSWPIIRRLVRAVARTPGRANGGRIWRSRCWYILKDCRPRNNFTWQRSSVAIEAGRLMLSRIENLLDRGETFSILPLLPNHTSILYVEHKQLVILSDSFSFGSILPSWHYNVLQSVFRKADTIFQSLS